MRLLSLSFLVLAAWLFGLNVFGLISPASRPTAIVEQRMTTSGSTLPTLSYNEAMTLVAEGARSSDFPQKLALITKGVGGGVVHYWTKEDAHDPLLRVPLRENYLLHAAGYVDPLVARLGYTLSFTNFEYMSAREALRRGLGLCSQVSLAVTDLLTGMGITAQMVGLDGHVVAMATDPAGRQYILDADYEVVLPFGIRHAEQNPAAVAEHYRAAGYPQSTAARVAELYGRAGNVVFPPGPGAYRPLAYKLIRATEVAIWIIPALLLAAGLWLGRAARKRADVADAPVGSLAPKPLKGARAAA